MAVLLGPLFVFPRGRWMWILLIVPVFWLLADVLERGWFRRTPVDAAIAFLAVWVLFSLLGVSDVAASLSKAAGFVYGILVFYAVVAAARTGARIKWGIAAFLAASVVIAVIGTLNRPEISSASPIDAHRVFSILPRINISIERAEAGVNPNPLGGTLLVFLPLGFTLIPGLLKKKLYLLLVLIVIAIDLAAIFYGRSFGAWAALLFSLAILDRRRRWLKAAVGIGLIVVIASFWVRIDQPVLPGDSSLRGALVHSISSRYNLWATGIAAVKERPLFGSGLDQFRLREDVGYDQAHAHNQFLHTAAELGIPGLAAYLAILIGAGWMVFRIEKSKKPQWMKDAAQGLAVGQIGLAVFGLVDAIALGAKPGLFFWISLSLIASIYLSRDEETKADNTCL